MNVKLNTIFSKSDCPAEGILQKYLDGKLTHEQRHEVEKHLIDCEMCSDELEGLRLLNDPKRLNVVINSLNSRIDKKFKIRQMNPFYNFVRIAAVILIFIVIGSLIMLYNHYNNSNSKNYIAENIQDDSIALKKETAVSFTENIDSIPQAVEEKAKPTENFIAQNKSFAGDKIEVNVSGKNTESMKTDGVVEINNSIADKVTEIDRSDSNTFTSMINRNENVLKGLFDSTQNDLAMKDDNRDLEEQDMRGESATGTSTNYETSTMVKGNKSKNRKAKEDQLSSAEEKSAIPSASADSDKPKKEEEEPMDYNSNLINLLNKALDDYTTEKYNDAIIKFEQILRDNNFTYFEKTQWYYALTLIKLNDTSEAKKLLNKIINTPNHQYASEAKVKLLELTDGN